VEKRRRPVRRHVRALIALAAFSGTSEACELPPGARVESDRISLSYLTKPASIEVGQPFVLEFAACAKGAAGLADRVKLDARMPEHRHGMNYRPSVISMGGGRFRSEGWLFHMPGHWEIIFDIGGERLTHSVSIE